MHASLARFQSIFEMKLVCGSWKAVPRSESRSQHRRGNNHAWDTLSRSPFAEVSIMSIGSRRCELSLASVAAAVVANFQKLRPELAPPQVVFSAVLSNQSC